MILIQIIFSRDNLDPKHDTLEDVSKEPEDWQEVNPGNVSVKVHCVFPKIYVDIFKDLKIIANRIKKYSIKVVPSSFACPPQALYVVCLRQEGLPPQNRRQGHYLWCSRRCSPSQ